jgi:hypothetical protein
MRMPPLAIHSRIKQLRIFEDRNMIASTASFLMMFQLVVIFGRNSFRSIGELQGFWKSGLRLLWMKLKNDVSSTESDFPGLGFAAVSDSFKKRLDEFNREFLQLPVAMVPAEWGDYRLIGP